MWVRTRPSSRSLALFVSVLLVGILNYAESAPLALEAALKGLKLDSSASYPLDRMPSLPRRQSLYLDCHRLAFADTLEPDPARAQPVFALLTPLAARQLDLMERFFDVLLADQNFAADSEAMAVAYIQFDRARERADLGQYSDLRVLELEAVYQEYLHRRTASQVGQQQTRALLAAAMGDIGELPRDLAVPTLPSIPKPLPGFEELRAKAALSGVQAVESLSDAERVWIERERGQQLFELLLRLELLDAARQRVRVESSRNDLKLDLSRTLYEQEVTADLGYSMSQQTRSRFDEQRVAYCRVLAWAEIQALIGEPVWTLAKKEP